MYVNAVNPPVIDSATFTNVPRNIPVYVPCGTKTDYETAILWDQFTNIIDRPAIILQVNNTVLGRVDTIQAYTCENDTVIIAAVPKSCYYFVAWDDDSTSNPRTFVLSRDTTFTAVFDSIIIALKDTIICYNTPATVTVSSNVPSAVYQWYSSLTDLTPFHTGSSYTTSNLTSDSTFYIDILGSDYCINGEIIRQSVTVTVYDSLIGGSIVEVDPYCYNSIHPTIEYFGEELPIGGSGNYSYQWQSSIDSAKTWTEIGTGKQTYTLSGELEHKTTLYRRVVTDKYGCGTVFSDTLTVHPVPTISAKLTEICPGVTTQVFPNRDGRWESSDSNIVDIIDSSTIVGKTPGTAKLTFYDSLAGSCSAPLSIIVTAFPDPEEITGDKVVCEGKEVVLSNTTPGGVWTHNNDNISIITQTNAPDKATVTLKGEKVGKSFVTYTVANGNGLCKSKRTFRLKIIDNTLPKVIIGIKR
jgi:hypothetical protein